MARIDVGKGVPAVKLAREAFEKHDRRRNLLRNSPLGARVYLIEVQSQEFLWRRKLSWI
jgi:hypothetical protein